MEKLFSYHGKNCHQSYRAFLTACIAQTQSHTFLRVGRGEFSLRDCVYFGDVNVLVCSMATFNFGRYRVPPPAAKVVICFLPFSTLKDLSALVRHVGKIR